MINDSHLHLGWSKEVLRGFNRDTFLEFKKNNNISYCFLFPIHGTLEEIEQSNRLILELNNIDEKIKPLYWLSSDPRKLDKAFDALDNGYNGFKYHAAYEMTPISHPLFENVLDYLNQKRGVLLVHCGMYKDGDISSDTSYLHPLITAAKFNNIKIILGHMGGSTLPIIKKVCLHARGIKNVWLETSGITSPTAIDYAVNHVGVDRVLFGSDAPWVSFDAMRSNVLDSNLTHEEKRKIFYDNFMEVLHH